MKNLLLVALFAVPAVTFAAGKDAKAATPPAVTPVAKVSKLSAAKQCLTDKVAVVTKFANDKKEVATGVIQRNPWKSVSATAVATAVVIYAADYFFASEEDQDDQF